MAISTNYDFNGILVPNAYIRINRIWGSSKEGWVASVGVYNVVTVPQSGIEGEIDYVPESQVKNHICEFNKSTPYLENERGYVSMYNALKEMYPNSTDC